MATKAENLAMTVEALLKQAGVRLSKKSEEALSEPSVNAGEATTHPSKNVDDGLQLAVEGERAAENKKSVKEQVGEASVDSTSETKAANHLGILGRRAKAAFEETAAKDQLQTGTNKQSTGNDPAHGLKSMKEQPKEIVSGNMGNTTSPVSVADTSERKYAADASFADISAEFRKIGNSLCDQIVKVAEAAAPAKTETVTTPTPTSAETAKTAGWDAAGLSTKDAEAVNALVRQELGLLCKSASDAADRYIHAVVQHRAKIAAAKKPAKSVKKAEGEMLPPEAMGGGGDSAAMMGGAAMGGDPAAAMAGAGGAGGGDDELQKILAALEAAGIDINQLLAGAGGGGGGEAGGLPGEEAAPPEAGGGDAPPPEKLASDKKAESKKAEASAMQMLIKELASRAARS